MLDGNPPMPGRVDRGRLSWTLLTLAVGYSLLVMGPLWNARGSLSHWLDDVAGAVAGLPPPLTIGLALLGAAALIVALARQVRDVDRHPYASIAPVLAVFSGLVLSSVRAQLPFPHVGGAQLALSGLTLALLGGALIGRRELGARVLGWALAGLPALALVLALTATRGDMDPLGMLQGVDAPLRAYLVLFAVSTLALALLGQFAQALVPPQPEASAPMLRLTPSAATPVGLRAPEYVRAAPSMRQSMAGAPHYESPAAFAAAYVPGSYLGSARPALDDPDLLALTRKRPLAQLAWLAVALLTLAGVGGYFFVMKPEQERQAAAEQARSLRAIQARTDQAAQPQDALADRMARYLQEREREQAPAAPSTSPVVTPLENAAAAAEPMPAVSEPAQARTERSHHHHRRHRARGGDSEQAHASAQADAKRSHAVEAKPSQLVEAKPSQVVEARPSKTVEAKPSKLVEAKPSRVVEAKPAPKTQNERELDLDELLQKSLKTGGKNSGADDPILGL